MELGEEILEFNVAGVGAANVARSTSARGPFFDGLNHRRAHGRVVAHAQIIVRAPCDDLAHAAGACPLHAWVFTRRAGQLCENAISPLTLERVNLRGK